VESSGGEEMKAFENGASVATRGVSAIIIAFVLWGLYYAGEGNWERVLIAALFVRSIMDRARIAKLQGAQFTAWDC
jgi:hypothetical protein